jgi:hypothetical protein
MRWNKREAGEASLGELMGGPPADAGDTIQLEPQQGADPDETILDDEDFLPLEHHGPGRLTVILVSLLVLVVGTLGGIWIQKQFGGSAAASGLPAGASGFPGGRPSGFPGGQGPNGQGIPGGNVPGAQPDSRGSTEEPANAPVVVGTVTSVKAKASSLVVTDLGDKSHQVKVSSSTTITMPYAHGELKAGDTVSIVGTVAAEIVTASAITVR